jgi:hypothetical protein
MFLIKKFLNSPVSSLSRSLLYLKQYISIGRLYRPSKVAKFVFLCGGSQDNGFISSRRSEIIKFIDKNLPNIKVFIAEPVFEILKSEGHKGNILDIEDQISKFADEVIIVLESNGAFCELGAFSSKSLRSKIIVINDEKYKGSSSFINLGPLEAIKEKSGQKKIIHYKMDDIPLSKIDAIGDIFLQLKDILDSIPPDKAGVVALAACNPKEAFEKDTMKDTLRFLHDLILFCGPITHGELTEVIIKIFGDDNYSRLKQWLGLLRSTNLIEVQTTKSGIYYISKMRNPLLNYNFDINIIISSFRTTYQKYDVERLSYVKK